MVSPSSIFHSASVTLPDFAEAELDAVFPVRTGTDVEGRFAVSEDGEDAELADLKRERLGPRSASRKRSRTDLTSAVCCRTATTSISSGL